MGRRKIEIKPIRDDRNRSVTFLKRKGGLFKKAHELSVLCSVDVAVIIFGHNNNKKLYDYSSSDINEIIGRFNYYGGAHEHKGPADFADKRGGGDDDDDDDEGGDEADERGTPQPDYSRINQQMQNHPGFQHVRQGTPSNSPPMHNGAMPQFQRGPSPLPQSMSRPSSRAAHHPQHIRHPSQNAIPQHTPPQGSYAFTPNPPFYNPQPAGPMQRPPPAVGQPAPYPPPYAQQPPPHPQAQPPFMQDARGPMPPGAAYTPPQANMGRPTPQDHLQPPPPHQPQPPQHQQPSQPPPPQQPTPPQPQPPQQQQHQHQQHQQHQPPLPPPPPPPPHGSPQPPQQQHLRPTHSPQPPQQQFGSQMPHQPRPLPATAKPSIFTPIDDSRSLLVQHWGSTSNNDPHGYTNTPARPDGGAAASGRSHSIEVAMVQRGKNEKANGSTTPSPPSRHAAHSPQQDGQRSGSTPNAGPPSRSSTLQSEAKRPRLKVQIPSEHSGDEGVTGGSGLDELNTANTNTTGHPQPSHGVKLPPPSPSAGALLSAGAGGPPNPFARPAPPMGSNPHAAGRDVGNHHIETPISALPSRFMSDNLLPSPSTFYPDWGFGRSGDSNMLPSPLNFQTPVAPNGAWGRDEDKKRSGEDLESGDIKKPKP